MECLACDSPINLTLGNSFYRLLIGFTDMDCHGVQFYEDCFEDGSRVKWLCMDCADKRGLSSAALDMEFCTFCMRDFEDDDEPTHSRDPLVRIEELVIRESRVGVPAHDVKESGHVHIECASEIDLPLWSSYMDRDSPCP